MRLPLALAAAIVLAACSASSGDESGGATADSATVAAPPPAADSAPAGADTAWRLTERGAGPVRVGMSIDELRQALGGDVQAEGGVPSRKHASTPLRPRCRRVCT